MLKSLWNRLEKIEASLKPQRTEMLTIYWYGPGRIEGPDEAFEPTPPGVTRTLLIDYAPPGMEVDWDESAGYYPPLQAQPDE
jgi:hypothetical protein